MKYKHVEFVDGGDNGRAPIGKAVARKYLDKPKIRGIKVESSGTLVNFLETAKDSQILELVGPYISVALDVEAITSEQAKDLKEGKNVRQIIEPILESITKDERERTIEILREKGLLRYVNQQRLKHPRQTTARTNAGLILSLSEKDYKRTVQIYSTTDIKPTIELLGEFQDPFFATLEMHKEIADQIEKSTVKTIEKYL